MINSWNFTPQITYLLKWVRYIMNFTLRYVFALRYVFSSRYVFTLQHYFTHS